MHRALRIDPESLQYAPVDGELYDVVRRLIERYTYRVNETGHSDDYFMLAVLHWLNDDAHAAQQALDHAGPYDDAPQSIHNLQQLLAASSDQYPKDESSGR